MSPASATAQGAADVAFPCTIRFCNEPVSASQKHQQSLGRTHGVIWSLNLPIPSFLGVEAEFGVGAAHRKDALRSPPTPSQSPFPSLRSSSRLPGGKNLGAWSWCRGHRPMNTARLTASSHQITAKLYFASVSVHKNYSWTGLRSPSCQQCCVTFLNKSVNKSSAEQATRRGICLICSQRDGDLLEAGRADRGGTSLLNLARQSL